jgi:hypothetical protein
MVLPWQRGGRVGHCRVSLFSLLPPLLPAEYESEEIPAHLLPHSAPTVGKLVLLLEKRDVNQHCGVSRPEPEAAQAVGVRCASAEES